MSHVLTYKKSNASDSLSEILLAILWSEYR